MKIKRKDKYKLQNKMTFRKKNPYVTLVNSYLIDSPQPSSINYWWNLGSLLGLCLVIQIASGIFLAMHYSSNIELAFNSVEHIMRDVNAGWLIRYIHANGASFFFTCMYLHIGKALYYGSYKSPRVTVWIIGVIIFVLTMATGFMGYTIINSPKSIKDKIISHLITKNKVGSYINVIPYRGVASPGLPGYNIQKRFFSYNNKLNKDINILQNIKSQDISNPEDIFKELCIKPEIWWENLNEGSINDEIRKELKNKSAIYIIINKISRNYYIGSAQTNNIYTRFRNHLLTNNKKGSKIVHKAVAKYGINNFIFAILEYYPYKVDRYNNEELLAMETSYIGLLLPKYNIMTEAGQFFGYKNNNYNLNNKLNLINLSLSKERKELLKTIKDKHNEELKLIQHNKLSNIASNRTPDYWTQEGIQNISKGSSKIIILKSSLEGNILCQFKNINTASHYLCCSNKTIQRSLQLGYLYLPDLFIPLLNPEHINNNNSIIEYIDKDKLYLYNYKNRLNKRLKLKGSLVNYNNYTKIIISSILSRHI